MRTHFNKSCVGFIVLFAFSCTEANEMVSNDCTKGSQSIAVDMCGYQPIKGFVQKVSSNPIFNVQNKIGVSEYSFIASEYSSGGDLKIDSMCNLGGDCCNMLRIVDRFSSTPELRWNTVSNKLIVAAIFEAPVELFA